MKAHDGMLPCPKCSPSSSALSRHVPAVWRALAALGLIWLAEVKVLMGWRGAADIWVHHLQLLIQVDGAQHTNTGYRSNTLGDQQAIDGRWNNEVLRQGMRALRLHWRDCEAPTAAIRAAVEACQQQPASNWVMFSSSYGRERQTEVEPLWDLLAAGGGSSR